MKSHLLSAAALGLVLGAPSVAAAQEGWYVSGGIGYGAPQSAVVSGDLGNAPRGGAIKPGSNWRFKVATGYHLADNWRIEGELAQRYNRGGAIANYEDSETSFHAWSAMLNVLYEFNFASEWRPYIGAGIGFVDSRGSLSGWTTGTRPVGSVLPDSRYIQVRDNDLSIGYQGIAGIAWPIGDRLTLDTEYRYFGYGSTRYDGVNVGNLSGHEAWVGLRYLFAAPPPPPPPPPPP
ncbi:outer membrane protein, partial [Alkalicaulis satelles]